MNVALRPEASSDLVSAAAYFNDIVMVGVIIFLIRSKSTLLIFETMLESMQFTMDYLASSPKYFRLQSTTVSKRSQRSSTRS